MSDSHLILDIPQIPLPTHSRFKNLSNKKFGRLTVIAYAGVKQGASWYCLCNCGALRQVKGRYLLTGHTKSCGCASREQLATRSATHGHTRGEKDSPTYRAWCAMRTRCTNPNHQAFNYYGGRGIEICEQWKNSFERFLADMGEKPSPDHTLERRDNEKGYEPSNCYWATKKDQVRNRRNTLIYTYKGQTSCLAEHCEKLNRDYDTVRQRLRKLNWPIEKAIETPTTYPYQPVDM